MEFSVRISDNGKYILCIITGEIAAKDSERFSSEMDTLSSTSGCKKTLIDVRNAKNVSSNLDNYEFAYHDINRIGLQRDLRTAILTSPGDQSHDFVKTVLLNAGYCVQSFCDEKEAIAWLEE